MYIRLFYLLSFSTVSIVGDTELKQVHVIFKHGGEVPLGITDDPQDLQSRVEGLTSGFYPQGFWGMTRKDMQHMYQLGEFLRERYNDFLGDVYTPEVMMMRTTEFANSMMSGQLVNAGLWPPAKLQQWDEHLMWQPIPSDYVPVKMDTLMMGNLCPTFQTEKKRLMERDEVQALIEPHLDVFGYLSRRSGLEIDEPSDVAILYGILEARANWNLTLPDWSDGIFPYGEMLNVTILHHQLSSWTSMQRRLLGGPLIKKMVTDCANHIGNPLTDKRKIQVYSGHGADLIGILYNLNMSYPHIPDIGEAIIFELHYDNVTDNYGIKIIYYTGMDDIPITLTLPFCDEFCPLGKFASLISDNIPVDEDSLCGHLTSTFIETDFTVFVDNKAATGVNDIFSLLFPLLICKLML